MQQETRDLLKGETCKIDAQTIVQECMLNVLNNLMEIRPEDKDLINNEKEKISKTIEMNKLLIAELMKVTE